jgi:hypothetical protein
VNIGLRPLKKGAGENEKRMILYTDEMLISFPHLRLSEVPRFPLDLRKRRSPMNDTQTRIYEMLTRVRDFGAAHATSFPAASLGGQKFVTVGSVVDELEQHGTAQSVSSSAAKTNTGTKKTARDEVRRKMTAISETARTMESTMPGITATFRIPNTNGDQALLNSARAFLESATPLKNEFISREMPADFLEDLTGAINSYESAYNSKNLNTEKRVTATAAIDAVVERGRELVRELDAIVRNKFRSDAATIAAWESASHVERSPRRKNETSAPTPPTPPT